MNTKKPQLIIIMGVSGCGKSTIASAYATANNMQFFDADDFHSDEAKLHMQKGLALTDTMRRPWIKTMVTHLSAVLEQGHSCTLAYSGLRETQRKSFLNINATIRFIHLVIPIEETIKRVSARKAHFFPMDLVNNQYDSLDPPGINETITEINGTLPIQDILNVIEVLTHSK